MSFESQRERMVEEQIRSRGVRDARVLEAMRMVPREQFVPERLAEFAYATRRCPSARSRRSRSPTSWP